jgi:hypothetical protein
MLAARMHPGPVAKGVIKGAEAVAATMHPRFVGRVTQTRQSPTDVRVTQIFRNARQ